jgi:hypothetical protein
VKIDDELRLLLQEEKKGVEEKRGVVGLLILIFPLYLRLCMS